MWGGCAAAPQPVAGEVEWCRTCCRHVIRDMLSTLGHDAEFTETFVMQGLRHRGSHVPASGRAGSGGGSARHALPTCAGNLDWPGPPTTHQRSDRVSIGLHNIKFSHGKVHSMLHESTEQSWEVVLAFADSARALHDTDFIAYQVLASLSTGIIINTHNKSLRFTHKTNTS